MEGLAMPLTDYTAVLDRIQKALALQYDRDSEVLNRPGVSVACKIDQNYYLVVEPLFSRTVGGWIGVTPDVVLETLTRTGNMITRSRDKVYQVVLRLSWRGRTQGVEAGCGFVLADFVDRALTMYSSRGAEAGLSDLKIAHDSRDPVEEFFQDKTPPGKWVYTDGAGK
jgi:hypothetical protein